MLKGTARDFLYDGTNHTINYDDENRASYTWLRRNYWRGPTHW